MYDAYGRVIGRSNPATPATGPPELRVGHKGLFFDRLDWGIVDPLTLEETPRLEPGATLLGYNRNRTLHVGWGRFLQRDPNATGLVVQAGLAFHGDGFDASVQGFDLAAHYGDGANVYEYIGSDPLGGSDPAGLMEFSLGGQMATMAINSWDMAEGMMETGRLGLQSGFSLASIVSDYSTWQEEDVLWALDWSRPDYDNFAGGVSPAAFGYSLDGHLSDDSGVGPVMAAKFSRNSAKSRAKNHGYEIDYFDPVTKKWEVWKWGISSTGTNAAGVSKRAQYQVNALNRDPAQRALGRKFRVSANDLRQFNSRKEALRWEKNEMSNFQRPPGMKRPRRRKAPVRIPKMPVKPGSKYWVGISRIAIRNDSKEDPALFGAEPIISRALLNSKVLDGTQWKGMTFLLTYFPTHRVPDRYRCTASRKHWLLHFNLSVSDEALRPMSVREYRNDVVRSFLIAVIDALNRRRVSTDALQSELALLPSIRRATAFINLLGDVRAAAHRADKLSGLEVSLLVPLAGTFPTKDELTPLTRLEPLIDRTLRAAKAGKISGREVGDGFVEYIISCTSHASALGVLRLLYAQAMIPRTSRAKLRNLGTGNERSARLSLVRRSKALSGT